MDHEDVAKAYVDALVKAEGRKILARRSSKRNKAGTTPSWTTVSEKWVEAIFEGYGTRARIRDGQVHTITGAIVIYDDGDVECLPLWDVCFNLDRINEL